MKPTFVLVVLTAGLLAASCSSSDEPTTPTTSPAVEVDVDSEVLDELVTICTEEQARFDDIDLDLNNPELEAVRDEVLGVLDSRIERLEEIEPGTAVASVNELIGLYEDHRDAAALLFEEAAAADIDAAVQAYGDGLFLLQDINFIWEQLGADACVSVQ